jgi:tetratricopeptide (TPR) repeat protein
LDRYLALEFPKHRFPREFAGVVHSKTEGNPLFMADLLRYLRDRKVITADSAGAWIIAQSLSGISSSLPQSVKSMIERKIEQLSERDREVLAAAAVEGYEFDSATLVRALQAGALEIEERLEALDHIHTFVRRIGEEEFPDRTLTVRYQFVHVLYQNQLFSSLSPARRMGLSSTLAGALEGFFGEKTSTIASRLGFLYETARDFSRASDYFGVAAQNASRIFANEEAIQLSRRGLELLMKLPDGLERTRKELDLQLTLAFAVQIARGYAAQETRTNMARAQELCQSSGDTPQLFPVINGLFMHYICKGDMKSARETAEHLLALARSANDAVLLIGALTAFGAALHHQGEIVSALAHLEECSRHYDPAKQSQYVQFYRLDPGAYARSEAVRALWLLGYPDQACQKLEENLALARTMASPPGLAFGLMFEALHYQMLRQPEKTKAIAEACIALCNEHGITEELAWVQCAYGWQWLN